MTQNANLLEVPTLDIDPFDFGVLANPYLFHERLREIGPVAYIAKHNNYVVGRYDEVRTVLRDWPRFTSMAGAGLTDIRKPGAWRQPGPIVEAEPPAHTLVRDLVSKIISPTVIRGWQQEFDAAAHAMVDELCDKGDIDGAKDISEAYVTDVFPKSLGLKPHRENMVIVGNFNFNALGPKNALYEKSQAELDSIAEWFATAQHRDGVEPGSFAEKIFDAADEGVITQDVAAGLVRTFLRGGMDTTISGISSTLMFLSQRPELWQLFRKDRTRLKFAFEESLRLESPIQSFFRCTTQETDLGGMRLNADVKVQVFIGAANRDPRRWTDPDTFDINRPATTNLAFGHGIHACVGQMIARMEAEAVLTALLDRCSAMEPRGEPEYRLLNCLRTIEELPLRLVPA